MSAVSTDAVEFRVGDTGSPQSFSRIAEVTEVPSYSRSVPVRDRTSVGDPDRVYEPAGPRDFGQMTVQMRLDPDDTAQQNIYSDWKNKTIKAFRIVDTTSSPEEALYEVEGFYVSYNSAGGGVESDLTKDVTIQVTKEVTVPDGN